MIRKRLKKKKKKKKYWPIKITPVGQFHPIHEIPVSSHGFHWITLGQSDLALAGAPSIHWMPEHRFPSDHTGLEWFIHRRTIHPLDAWTWTSPVPRPSTVSWVITVTEIEIPKSRNSSTYPAPPPPSTKHMTGNGQWLEKFPGTARTDRQTDTVALIYKIGGKKNARRKNRKKGGKKKLKKKRCQKKRQ
jgi:hypothetical protein